VLRIQAATHLGQDHVPEPPNTVYIVAVDRVRRKHRSVYTLCVEWAVNVSGMLMVCVFVCVDSLMGFLNILVKNNYSGKIW
jgi:hypothetical protein